MFTRKPFFSIRALLMGIFSVMALVMIVTYGSAILAAWRPWRETNA